MEGIRPLYYVQFVGYGLVLAFVAVQLREPRAGVTADTKVGFGFLTGLRDLFGGRRDLWRWVALVSITGLPMAVF